MIRKVNTHCIVQMQDLFNIKGGGKYSYHYVVNGESDYESLNVFEERTCSITLLSLYTRNKTNFYSEQ
jgi:hypothetical protein